MEPIKHIRESWASETYIDQYASLAEYGAAVAQLAKEHPTYEHLKNDNVSGPAWYGGTLEDAVSGCSCGAKPAVTQKVDQIIDQIEDALPLTQGLTRWGTDIQGYVPHVPNLLCNVPDTMLVPNIFEESMRGPITIIVGMWLPGMTPQRVYEARGAAVTALAVKLSQYRPVNLQIYDGIGKYGSNKSSLITVDVGVAPVNVPLVAYAFADLRVTRRLGLGHAAKYQMGLDSTPPAWNCRDKDKMRERVRQALRLSGDVLIIDEVRADDPMVTSPIEWVDGQLKQHVPELQEI